MLSNVNLGRRKRQKPDNSPGNSPNNVSPPSKHVKVDKKIPLSLAEMIAKPQSTSPPEVASTITVRTNMTKSIYISPFKPMIEPADILNHLKSIDDLKHIVPGIECTKLVSNKKNRRISFVSFKLDVPRHHYEMVTDPKHWQMNDGVSITIQEFVDKRALTPTGNPFAQRTQSQRQGANQRATSNVNGNRQRNTGNPNSRDKQRSGQNFQPEHRNPRPKRSKPLCSHCRSPCDENRSGRRRR